MYHLEFKEVCKSCKGTGIYVGMAEQDGFGVQCSGCGGSGCYNYVHKYEVFEKRKIRTDIKKVIEVNVGIVVGGEYTDKFGGMPYNEWLENNKFPPKSEMRNYTCPAWWYQSADYKKKPNWNECMDSLGNTFSACPHFKSKNKCWAKFDKETK